jgi:hypothetical protein
MNRRFYPRSNERRMPGETVLRRELSQLVFDCLLDGIPHPQAVLRIRAAARTPGEFDRAVKRLDTAGISAVTEARR